MDFFVWDKQSSVLGLSANALLSSRPDFKYDDVIVIHVEGDKNNVVMMETKDGLRSLYDIDSDNPDVIGFVVSVILEQEKPETMKHKVDEFKKEAKNNEPDEFDIIQSYTDMLEDILNDSAYTIGFDDIPLTGEYKDPECTIIDLSDVDENVDTKTLVVELNHVFVTESMNVTDMKCMSKFNSTLEDLFSKKEQAMVEGDDITAGLIDKEINLMLDEISDSCDATIKFDAKKIYQYDNVIMIDCENGQTFIISKDVVNSMRTNSIEYEKRREDSDEKYRVHYKTVNIVLDECFNELVYMTIGDKTYTKETLSEDTIGLLTALSYTDENEIYLTETYETLVGILGYDIVINGLKEIHELGFDLIPQHKFRKLVIDKNKKKYNGMMRDEISYPDLTKCYTSKTKFNK